MQGRNDRLRVRLNALEEINMALSSGRFLPEGLALIVRASAAAAFKCLLVLSLHFLDVLLMLLFQKCTSAYALAITRFDGFLVIAPIDTFGVCWDWRLWL